MCVRQVRQVRLPRAYELGICLAPAQTRTRPGKGAVVLSLGEVDNLWDESLGAIRISIISEAKVNNCRTCVQTATYGKRDQRNLLKMGPRIP